MNLEKQVISLELAKKLKELGVPQESIFWWKACPDGMTCLYPNCVQYGKGKEAEKDYYSAFTTAELGEMLPMIYIPVRDGNKGWLWSYDGNRNYENTEADARATCLIHLLEQGIISVNDIQKST